LCLSEIGFETLLSYSGKEGIKKYGENKDDIVLVILDYEMPYLNGVETL